MATERDLINKIIKKKEEWNSGNAEEKKRAAKEAKSLYSKLEKKNSEAADFLHKSNASNAKERYSQESHETTKTKNVSNTKDHTNQHTAKIKEEPNELDESTMTALIRSSNKNKNINEVTIKDDDGHTIKKIKGYILNEVTYVVDKKTKKGVRLVDGGSGKGIYKKDKMSDIDGWSISNANHSYETIITLSNTQRKERKTSVSKSTSPSVSVGSTPVIVEPVIVEPVIVEPVIVEPVIVEPVPPAPIPPSRPVFTSFNEIIPSFHSDLQTIEKFSYYFGIDDIKLINKQVNRTACFISKNIDLGDINKLEYIQLKTIHDEPSSSSIEFYIVDSDKEIPILPINNQSILNERIFYKLDTRFAIDEQELNVLKKNSKATSVSLSQAINSTEGSYTISYTPKDGHRYKPLSNRIQIKVILRTYDIKLTSPTIAAIEIQKFGGNSLWKESI